MVAVRWARQSESLGVLPLFEGSMASEGLPGNGAGFLRAWRDSFRKGSTFRFVVAADPDGAIVGCCTVHRRYGTYRGQPVVGVEDVFVVEDRRGQGIGTALLRFAERWGIRLRAARVELHVRAGNAATTLYARAGYESADYVWMQKWLPTLRAAGSPSGGRTRRGGQTRNR